MPFLASFLMPHAPVFINEVGGGQVGSVKKTIESMKNIAKEIKELAPDTIIVLSPHGPVFTDAISVYNQKEYKGDFRDFADYTNEYKIQKDQELIDLIIKWSDDLKGDFYPIDEEIFVKYGHTSKLDHGILVPLHFVLQENPHVNLVAMSYGSFSYQRLIENGEILGKAFEESGKRIVFIASGDMSHALMDRGPYDYHEEGPWFDLKMCHYIDQQTPWEIFSEPDKKIASAKECGLRSFAVMMGLLKDKGFSSKLISYEGPFGVGYLCASFMINSEMKAKDWWSAYIENKKAVLESSRKSEHHYVKFARTVINSRIVERIPPKLHYEKDASTIFVDKVAVSFPNLEELLSIKRATFVTIKNQNGLRGCIGTMMPVHGNIIEEIYHNAIAAATKDYRFHSIDASELEELIISVDVLSEMEAVIDYKTLNPRVFGVLVVSKGHSGVLLPDLEGIDSAEDQLRIACQKGGFSVDEIEETYRFTVDRYH